MSGVSVVQIQISFQIKNIARCTVPQSFTNKIKFHFTFELSFISRSIIYQKQLNFSCPS